MGNKTIIAKVGINNGVMNIEGYDEIQKNRVLKSIQCFDLQDGKSPLQIIYVDEDKVIMKVLLDCKPNNKDSELDLYKD